MNELNIPQQNFSGTAAGGELSLYQYFVSSPLFAEFKDFNSPERKLFLSDYSKMPQNVKTFFSSVETATFISTLGLNYRLDDNQISALAGTLRDIMTGKIFIKDFPVTLSSKLGVDDTKAGEIANKIVSQSFGPIIDYVKRVQRSKFPDKISQIQKESQPAGLTQPGARPLPSQPANTPQMPVKQPQAPPSVRPPVQLPSQPPPSPKPPEIKPQEPPQPETVKPAPLPAPPVLPRPMAEVQPPKPKPEFKVPDLSGIKIPPVPPGQPGESLEKELEKVANIIDLRNKPQE